MAVRGRISVPLSLDDVTDSLEGPDSLRNRRGWLHTDHFSTSPKTSPLSREPSIPSTPRDESQGTHSYHTPDNAETTQNSKRPVPIPSTIHPPTPAPRSWTVRIPTPTNGLHLPAGAATPPTFSTHSPISRFTRYVPRMSLFREVMRDEVYQSSSLWMRSDLCIPL